ncbi:MAG TPA: universal stress protein [Gemmatimonadaceae bacterium]
MFETIVVPLDGSALAEGAIATAVDVCRRMRSKLVLLRVHKPPETAITRAYEWDRETRRREQEYLETLVGRLRERFDAEAESAVLDGHAADAIADAAEARPTALIVMTSHGRTGFNRAWIGSVADAIVRRASTPVLLVRGAKGDRIAAETTHPNRIVVPLDGNTAAREILPSASAMATALDATLELVRVVTPSDVPDVPPDLADDAAGAALSTAEDELRSAAAQVARTAPALAVKTQALSGESAAEAIIGLARPSARSMVAMTTRSHGLKRLVLGSVADKIIRGGPRFVLLLQPGDQ